MWFDETQAWQIAKCASYKELFTYIPHYEGHPPLWHLILSVFAKNGAPVDITLKAINITFCSMAMGLVIFRSPFPNIVRYLLPFTYFFFYHYGINCRPYSMTMLAVMIAAMTYKERNIKPWRYIFSLIFLCLTTAFGIMISGGLCIVWSFEIITELVRGKKLALFWKDKRFNSLCVILAAAVVLIIMIIPADDCFYGGVELQETLFDKLKNIRNYKTLIILPFESWSGVLIGVDGEKDYSALLMAETVIGAVMWLALIVLTKKNGKLFTFLMPYIFMTGFMSFNYMSAHHIGVSSLFHVFIFWIMAEQDGGIKIPESFRKLRNGLVSPMIRRVIYGVCALVCVMPVVYSIGASYLDIKGECGVSRFAEIIKDNNLEDKKIMAKWNVTYDTVSEEGTPVNNMLMHLEIPSVHGRITDNRTFLMGDPPIILPFFDRNIFMNFNTDCPDDMYMHYKYKEDTEAVFEKWREKGLPDFIIGYCPIDEVYDEETLEGVKYLPIYSLEYNIFYKLDFNIYSERMYMREDLFDEYPQFKWIDDQKGNVYERK